MSFSSKLSGLTVSDWIAIVLVLAGLVHVIFLPNASEQLIQGTLLAVLTLVMVLFRILGSRAAVFWRKFGFVPAPTDSGSPTIVLAILYDPTGRTAAAEIQSRHMVTDIDPRIVPIDLSKDPNNILPSELATASAVYLVWTEATYATPTIVQALDDWAWKHMEVPILVVNPYSVRHEKFTFKVINKLDEASPAQLLVQGISRTRQWIRLAATLHRWWLYASAIGLIALIVLSVAAVRYHSSNKLLAERDEILEPNFTLLASRLFASRLEEDHKPSSAMLNGDLAEIAKYLKDDIARITHIQSGSTNHISVFRRFSNDLIQVDGSALQVHGGGTQRVPLTLDSIAGGALRATAFILWEKDCRAEDPAAWDKEGTIIGSCLPKDRVQLTNGEICRYQPGNTGLGNKGILCYAPELNAGGEMADTVVCLVTPDRNTAFLHTAAARAKLRMVALVANSLPTHTLLAPAERAKYGLP